jgi:hypothetical protein
VPERLRGLVFVDSAPFPDGMAYIDISPPEALAALRETVDVEGEGWRLPFPGIGGLAENASIAGLGEAEQTLMTAKATAQPWGTYTQPLRLTRPQGTALGYEQVAIACDDMKGLIASGEPLVAALAAPPWRYLELETGHWPMLSAPDELAQALDGLASAG